MQPFQQRVVDEKAELDVKLVHLKLFTAGRTEGIFKSLPVDEQLRLYRQEYVMQLYSNILAERIAAFNT